MKKINLFAFALGTADAGYRNQLLGALNALRHSSKTSFPSEKCFLLPEGVPTIWDMHDSFCYAKFSSYEKFRQEMFAMMDKWMAQALETPRVFVTAYNFTESNVPEKNADMACRAVKEYYKKHQLGKIFTVVLSSKLHNYKYVDLINVPKHLLTFYSRIRLVQNKKLRKKTLITIGTIHKFNQETVLVQKKTLDKVLEMPAANFLAQKHLGKLAKILHKDKKVVICLGGRVEGREIIFGINYARDLLEKCTALTYRGYGIVIVNGPRTPNDVTDYLYENTLQNPDIIFHNCKKIASFAGEAKQWRLYSGKFEKDFSMLRDIGNIYPAVLGYGNTLAVHTIDSYACCETITAGIPTAISGEGIYIDKTVRGDCLNMFQLLTPKYALSLEDFINLACYMKIEPRDLRPAPLSNLLNVFAEAVRNRIN